LVITTVAALFDISVKKIPNWLVLFGLSGGLLLNALQVLSHLYNSIIGLLLGIAIFFIPFALGWVGAGDVKYLGVVGSILGYQLLPRILFYSILAAGLLALGFIIYNRVALSGAYFLRNAWLDCKLAALSFGRMLPPGINVRASSGSQTIPWELRSEQGQYWLITWILMAIGQGSKLALVGSSRSI